MTCVVAHLVSSCQRAFLWCLTPHYVSDTPQKELKMAPKSSPRTKNAFYLQLLGSKSNCEGT